jgi:hypothetical protein
MNGFVQNINGYQKPILARAGKHSRIITNGPLNIRPVTCALAGNQLNQAEFTD